MLVSLLSICAYVSIHMKLMLTMQPKGSTCSSSVLVARGYYVNLERITQIHSAIQRYTRSSSKGKQYLH